MTLKLSYNLVKLPLLTPFTTSFGTQVDRVAYVFTLESDGITAYSESTTDVDPFYSYEDNITAMHLIRDYLSKEISDLPTPQAFMERVEHIKGHNMAKATVEMLLWDYHSKSSGISLHKYLGKSKGYADVGISIGMLEEDKLVPTIMNAVNKGYKRIKLKISKGKETKILSTARLSFPDITLSADANCDYRLEDIETLQSIDQYNLAYLEQPLGHDDIIDHASLRQTLSTPICLDEAVTSPDLAREAFQIDAVDIVNIKPGRVGGLYNSLKIAEIVQNYGGHAWVGGMLETGIGRAFNIALASNHLIDMPGDTSPNEKYFSKDIVRNVFKMDKGTIAPFESPGIGVVVDTEYLAMMSIESGEIPI
ncbi:MAG: o-succinylbenzoate synthase [Candidatus Thermoplasmatota archaeon]|nr:o-succinylbenzoate synthase [Candidatus Thermoplasmatota archaeon]